MKSFEPGFLENTTITPKLLQTVRLLGEFKGKEELFQQQAPQALETLRQAAMIQSAESSNRIEGVTAPLERIRAIVDRKARPRDRSEQEIAGYRDVLNTIHADHEHIPLTPGVVLQFHRDLYRYSEGSGGKWKAVDNEIAEFRADGSRVLRFRPVSAAATPEAMEQLHLRFNTLWDSREVERLILISAYVLDFLCIHPFLDGNGRMARLLGLLLLHQAGYSVGRFISLEKIIEDSRESYYETLNASSQEWHEGRHDLLPWNEYFLGILVAAYRAFEERMGILIQAKGAKTEMVLESIRSFRREFSIKDIQGRCPNVGIDLIRRILRNEKTAGRIQPLGRGPAARWKRIGTIPNK